MISPVNGRVVWYRPIGWRPKGFVTHGDQPCAAQVVYIWSDRMVNLSVLDHNGKQHAITSVMLLQDNDATPEFSYCEWMPYQKGQAAK